MKRIYAFKKLFALTFLVFPAGAACFGQSPVYRHYNTQEVRRYSLQQNPDYAQNLTLLENAMSNYGARGDDGGVLRVPVIFHIISPNGKREISEVQIRSQLEILNKWFVSVLQEQDEYPNEDVAKFFARRVNPNIQFYLPEKQQSIPLLNIPAIHYVDVPDKKWGIWNEVQDPEKGGAASVIPDRVVNIWVAKFDSLNAGYAHLPGGAAALDGIVINADFFADAKPPYDQGKTLVHLMGTYLGLYELWDETEPCKDDLVADTPLHQIPTNQVSTEKNTRSVCFCPGTPTAMYMNFMDNTRDEQLSIFTEGQRRRMRTVLLTEGLRSGLVTR